MNKNEVDVLSYDGEGYLPMVDFESWRVAELRYCEELEANEIKTMQKHNESDEVFVLLKGDCTMYIGGRGDFVSDISGFKLEPLKIYNIKKGTFHTHTPEKGTTILIVENKNTCDDNSPTVELDKSQKDEILRVYKELNQ